MLYRQYIRANRPRDTLNAVPQGGSTSCEESSDYEATFLRKKGWDKPTFNFVIDALMFLSMMAMAGLGFLMKYVLLPGQERWVKYGRNVNLTLFGWDRHDWGSIHLYLGLFFLGLLALHIILHWKLIVCLFQRLLPFGQTRTAVLVIFVILAVLFIYFPFLVLPEIGELGRGMGRVPR